MQSRQFLDQVRLAGQIAATRWHNDLDSPAAWLPLRFQSERSEELFRLLRPDANSQDFFDTFLTQKKRRRFRPARVAVGDSGNRNPSRHCCKKIDRAIQRAEGALRVDASFKTVRCFTMEPQPFCRAANGSRIEIGALQQDGTRLCFDFGIRSAHHARQRDRPVTSADEQDPPVRGPVRRRRVS